MTMASVTRTVKFAQKGATGNDGTPGKRGMLPFPAGEYSASTRYTATANVAPYVLLSGTYYVMNKVGSWLGTSTGKTPAQDYATNGLNATWLPFENFKAIYVELLMARLGLIGKAVFYDEFMFSQHGTDASGNPSTNYQGFANGTFTPNILLNFMSGAGHFANKNIRWSAEGLVDIMASIRYPFRPLSLDDTNPEVQMDIEKGGNVITQDVLFMRNKGFWLPDATQNPGTSIKVFYPPVATRVAYEHPYIWTTGRFFSANVPYYSPTNSYTQVIISSTMNGGLVEFLSLPAGMFNTYEWYIVNDSIVTFGNK